MPFRHVAMFRWADDVDAETTALVAERLSELPGVVDTIRSYQHGADVGVSDGNFDYAVVADFDNVEGWRVYRDHPTHLLLIEELIKPNISARAAIQYQTR